MSCQITIPSKNSKRPSGSNFFFCINFILRLKMSTKSKLGSSNKITLDWSSRRCVLWLRSGPQ
jgi:hypothetical protein